MSEAEKTQAEDNALVDEEVGVAEETTADDGQIEANETVIEDADPYSIKKRLSSQARKHQKEKSTLKRENEEIRQKLVELERQLAERNTMQEGQPNQPMQEEAMGQQSQGQMQPQQGGMDEQSRIRAAVQMALDEQKKQQEAAKAQAAQQKLEMEYSKLQERLRGGSSKYEDFEQVVMSSDAPFSSSIRDALLLVPNPVEVAYALGKDREKLMKLKELDPLEQVREVTLLSHAKASASGGKESNKRGSDDIMGELRPNPARTSDSFDPTSKDAVSQIRNRIRSKNRRQ